MATDLKTLLQSLDQTHARRLTADKAAKELASQEQALKQELINHMVEHGAASIGSESYMYSVKEKTRYQVLDWPSVYEYIATNDAWEIMYRRLNEAAVADRQGIPGTEEYTMNELSIRARS
jgi:hypothetical protein